MLHVLPFFRQHPAEGLARDDELFRAVEGGGGPETLRIWEADRLAVILGRFGTIRADVCEEACHADGVPILRRTSGGGTVLVGSGCLLVSLVFDLHRRPRLTNVADSYRVILDAMLSVLSIPGGTRRNVSDLAIGAEKVSGNAQRRGRRALLHQGTVLYDCRPQLLARYLREPARQPPYRAGRLHEAFVRNVPVPRREVARRLRRLGDHLAAPSRLLA
ncbi:MAG: lipoate--protein ligase family protein [Acidobacteriota bacterium]